MEGASCGHDGRPILSGTFSGVEVVYINTERELGVILEVFSGMPKKQTEKKKKKKKER